MKSLGAGQEKEAEIKTLSIQNLVVCNGRRTSKKYCEEEAREIMVSKETKSPNRSRKENILKRNDDISFEKAEAAISFTSLRVNLKGGKGKK